MNRVEFLDLLATPSSRDWLLTSLAALLISASPDLTDSVSEQDAEIEALVSSWKGRLANDPEGSITQLLAEAQHLNMVE